MNAPLGKIKEHIVHSVNVMKTSWNYSKLNWYTISGRNNLNCKAIKIFSQGGFEASELFAFNNSGTGYAYIFTYWNRKAVNNVFTRKINSFYDFRKIEKQIDN